MAIRPVLGSDLYDLLKTELKARTVSEENTKLLAEFIRPAVAHLVIAEAMDVLPVQITENGVRVVEMLQSFPSDVMEKNAPEAVRASKKSAAMDVAKQYLSALVTELKDNGAELYPTYYAQMSGDAAEDRNATSTNKIYRA
jgi:hypothetical protein